MGADFLILFLTCVAFWFLAGKLIDDVMDRIDDQWTRAWAHEDISRRDESKGAA